MNNRASADAEARSLFLMSAFAYSGRGGSFHDLGHCAVGIADDVKALHGAAEPTAVD